MCVRRCQNNRWCCVSLNTLTKQAVYILCNLLFLVQRYVFEIYLRGYMPTRIYFIYFIFLQYSFLDFITVGPQPFNNGYITLLLSGTL